MQDLCQILLFFEELDAPLKSHRLGPARDAAAERGGPFPPHFIHGRRSTPLHFFHGVYTHEQVYHHLTLALPK